jgi:hypothetical protein
MDLMRFERRQKGVEGPQCDRLHIGRAICLSNR